MKNFIIYTLFSYALCFYLFLTPLAECGETEEEIIVSAASSLTNVFKDIAKSFEESHKGLKIILNFAGSGSLLYQIATGAPVDVFASADQVTMDQAQEKKLIITETRKNFVRNALVLIVPKRSDIALNSINDLTEPHIKRIALGNPATVPAGSYTKEALVNHGLWDKLSDKYIFGNHVRQVLDYTSRGEVSIGFVYSTDALIAQEKVRVVSEVTKHTPVLYSIAVVQSTKQKESARSFIDFTGTSEAREIFKKHGFKTP